MEFFTYLFYSISDMFFIHDLQLVTFFVSFFIFYIIYELINSNKIIIKPIYAILGYVSMAVLFSSHSALFGGDGANMAIKDQFSFNFGWQRGIWVVQDVFNYIIPKIWCPSDKIALFFTQQVFSWTFGLLFIYYLFKYFSKLSTEYIPLVFLIATSIITLNFYGQSDCYSLPLLCSLIYFTLVRKLIKDTCTLKHLLILVILNLLLLYIHPFNIFLCFITVYVFINKYLKLSSIYNYLSVILYTVLMIGFMSIKGECRDLFIIKDCFMPIISSYTFIHWLNGIFIPLVPILIISLLLKNRLCIFISIMFSIVFSCLKFSQGAVDILNYYFIAFNIYMVILYILIQDENFTKILKHKIINVCIGLNIIILISALIVQSSPLILNKALIVYPMDHSRDNLLISWESHLLLKSTQAIDDKALMSFIEKVLQEKVKSGDMNDKVTAFVYEVAWCYNYGEVEKGRGILYKGLLDNPNLIGCFLNERPGLIYKNQELLWGDIRIFCLKVGLTDKRLWDILSELKVRQQFFKE